MPFRLFSCAPSTVSQPRSPLSLRGGLRCAGSGMKRRDDRNCPVRETGCRAISSGVPCATTCPPSSPAPGPRSTTRSEEHTSELQSQSNLVCRLLLEKKKKDVAHPTDHQR